MKRSLSESDLREDLRRFICVEVLRRPGYRLGDSESLIQASLIDSYGVSLIGSYVEQEYDIFIPEDEMTANYMDTLNLIVTLLLGKLEESA